MRVSQVHHKPNFVVHSLVDLSLTTVALISIGRAQSVELLLHELQLLEELRELVVRELDVHRVVGTLLRKMN